MQGVHDRCEEFLNALVSRIERHPTLSHHQNILLVSHAATCAAMARVLIGDRELPLRVGTCTLSILQQSGAGWKACGTLAGAEFLPGGVERDWGFEDVVIDPESGEVISDAGGTEDEDPGFTGLVPEKS